MNILADELASRYEEVYWDEFYSDIFEDTLRHKELDKDGEMTPGEYIAIATTIRTLREKTASGRRVVRSWNHFVYDGLDTLDWLVHEDSVPLDDEEKRLTIISPVSYAGSRRLAKNARFLYALCVELDGLRVFKNGKQIGLENLYLQIEKEYLPKPTYIVASGNGLHLYYKFVKPIPCFKNVVESLARYKHDLTKRLWNARITTLCEDKDIQYESVFQGFRMVGTRTKAGDRTRAFRTGDSVTIEYMNRWGYEPRNERDKRPDSRIVEIYKSELTRAKAKELYPDWYERRVVRGEGKGHWVCNRAVYDWWKRRIEVEAVVGHRYYCLMCLCVYAIKCGIEEEELERDCYELMQAFEELTPEGDSNHFDEEDVESAMAIYRSRGLNLCTYPIDYISDRSGLVIEKNRRNGRKQVKHLEVARAFQHVDYPNGEWRNKEGAPKKKDIVKEWKGSHPYGSKADCIRDTGLSKPTVYKWWEKV